MSVADRFTDSLAVFSSVVPKPKAAVCILRCLCWEVLDPLQSQQSLLDNLQSSECLIKKKKWKIVIKSV